METPNYELTDEQTYGQPGAWATMGDAAAQQLLTQAVGTGGIDEGQTLSAVDTVDKIPPEPLYGRRDDPATMDLDYFARSRTSTAEAAEANCPGDACTGVINVLVKYKYWETPCERICHLHSERWLASAELVQLDARAIKAGIPARCAGMSLETYPSTQDPAALQAVRDWLDSDIPALVLLGAYGRGKTGLAASAARELLKRSRGVQWANATALQHDLFGHDEYLQRLKSVKALVVDDLGAGRNDSPWVLDLIYTIINHRHDHSLRTIYTSNYRIAERVDPAKLAELRAEGVETLADRITQRTVERLLESHYTTVVTVRGSNLRTDRELS